MEKNTAEGDGACRRRQAQGGAATGVELSGSAQQDEGIWRLNFLIEGILMVKIHNLTEQVCGDDEVLLFSIDIE